MTNFGKNYIDADKLNGLMKEIWETAKAHGWHDESLSPEHYLGLIMTEVAEAVEADRNGKRAKTDLMADVMKIQGESEIGPSPEWYENWFKIYYCEYVKGSIEEEFADIVIRILDMTNELHGDKMKWVACYGFGEHFRDNRTFVENAWVFVKEWLNYGRMNITDAISFMYAWADNLGMDLDAHIRWKMKYNEMRPYKHGGKRY